MGTMASQITSLTLFTQPSMQAQIKETGANQRKHQSSASLAFVRGIHWWPVNSPHKGPVTRKMFSFDAVIMFCFILILQKLTELRTFKCQGHLVILWLWPLVIKQTNTNHLVIVGDKNEWVTCAELGHRKRRPCFKISAYTGDLTATHTYWLSKREGLWSYIVKCLCHALVHVCAPNTVVVFSVVKPTVPLLQSDRKHKVTMHT